MWVDEIDPENATAEQVAWLKRECLAEREAHRDSLKKSVKALEQCLRLHNHKSVKTTWLVIAMIGTQVFVVRLKKRQEEPRI